MHEVLVFHVPPPFWLTWWFLILATLVLVSALFLTIELRTRAIRKKNLKLTQIIEQRTESLLAERTESSLGRMIIGVAHELNTPLGMCVTGISHLKSFTDSFSEQAQPQITETLLLVESALQRSIRLVNAMKELDSTDATASTLIAPQHLLACLSEQDQRLLERHKLNILFENRCQEPLELPPSLIGKLLGILLRNAAEHAYPNGSGSVTVRIEQMEHMILLTVKDEGAGMRTETIAHAIEPFYKEKMGSRGFGLGLTIANNLVTKGLRGTMSIESTPGKGTLVRVHMPMKG